MRKFVAGTDYDYVVDEKDATSVHIKLLTGEYEGTVYKYGKVGIEEKDGNAYLQFNFDVISSPITKVAKSQDFRNYIGDLLMDIVTSKLDMEDEDLYDENRTDDSEEPDLQRGLL